LISRLHSAGSRVLETWDLWRRLEPGNPACRVFGSPSFGGGPGTKREQLRASCAGTGEAYGTLICLSAVRVPLFALRLLRQRGARVVVNQNGVYYPLWSADFERRNGYLRALNELADHSFFQSEFALESYRRWVGEPPASHSLLYNGVDRAIFRPDFARASNGACPRVLVFVDFRESTRDIWLHCAAIAPSVGDAEWVLVGRAESPALVSEVRARFEGLRAEFHPDPGARVPELARGVDVALHFVYNDVCPNKVLECLASGVHVICSSAGGAKELVRGGGGETLRVPEGYDRRAYPTVADVRGALDRFRADPERLRRAAFEASAAFDLAGWLRAMTGDDNSPNAMGRVD
jgi:glycosyltransferase involved in cell wall biosynthesis